MTSRNFAKSAGFAIRRERYSMLSDMLDGRKGGHSGHWPKSRAVLQQCTRCTGVFLQPQEQSSLALSCANFMWYQEKSPWDERSASRRWSIAHGKSSSGSGLTLYSRHHFLYHAESLVLCLDVSGHTVRRALGTLEYYKCIACKKGWVNEQTAEKRVDHACIMLEW